ncbi:MAG TPA: flagellar motor switch protein FliN [Hyphomicrobiaceae bacterium]|nr:flagellar motor switch protein FliN [Hyphomicrobiaceae bacterium]
MTDTAPLKHGSLLQEYAAELTPTPEELAVALGPAAGRASNAGKPRPPEPSALASRNLEMVMRIPVTMKIVLGSATMPVASLVKLGRGAVIPLERRVGEPVDVVVNDRVIARGEVVVVDETTSRFGISLTEIIGPPGNEQPQ